MNIAQLMQRLPNRIPGSHDQYIFPPMMYPGPSLMYPNMIIPTTQQLGFGGSISGIRHFPHQFPLPHYYNTGASPSLPTAYANPHIVPTHLEPIFSLADEQLLAGVLREGRGKLNLNESLRSLNGVSNHSTEQWITFYVKNSIRVDSMSSVPVEDSFPKAERSSSSSLPPTRSTQDTKAKSFSSNRRTGSDRGRQYCASKSSITKQMKTPSWTRTQNKRGRDVVPALSPTPPTKIVPAATRGNKYTNEDRVFFKKVLVRQLQEGFRSLGHLAQRLARGAPHHSALSWRSWMRDNPDMIKDIHKVLGQALTPSDLSFVSYDDSEHDDSEHEESEHDQSSLPEFDVNEEDVSLASSESESEIRRRDAVIIAANSGRNKYLPSERRAFAKYIAELTLTEWDDYGLRTPRWRAFQENVRIPAERNGAI
ncbi:hypothetical protein K439DRAFT_524198 [Ramaria rubella]|nr:hypothetical protein K439DRAFT_524198 [Ramaria rubella]